MLILFYIKKLI